MITFLYRLIDPRDGRVRYVGRSRNPSYRLKQHLEIVGHGRGAKVRWVTELLALGMAPQMQLVAACDAKVAHLQETILIEYYATNGADLVNSRPRGGRTQDRRPMAKPEWLTEHLTSDEIYIAAGRIPPDVETSLLASPELLSKVRRMAQKLAA